VTPEDARHLEAFLAPSHIVVVATIGPSGMPQLTPNWYAYANGKLMMSTTKERVEYRNLTRDNRMSVCIYASPQVFIFAPADTPGEMHRMLEEQGCELILGKAFWDTPHGNILTGAASISTPPPLAGWLLRSCFVATRGVAAGRSSAGQR